MILSPNQCENHRRDVIGATVIGIDIGGANLKYASSDGRAASFPFAMWKQSDELMGTLVSHLRMLGRCDRLAVTMTGELADCFIDREVGVAFIVDAVMNAAHQLCGAEQSLAPELLFYGVDGVFHDANAAKRMPALIAAANWHALASFVARSVAPDGILVDIGSTTTDIIPIVGGSVATDALTDHQRLIEQSLVYIGCRRTPVCGLAQHLLVGGKRVPVMNELFATIDDVRIVLGDQPESETDCDSADGGPRTIERAANRVARMVGLDRTTMPIETATDLCLQIKAIAASTVNDAIVHIADRATTGPVVMSGHGTDLIDPPPDRDVVVLSDWIGEPLSRCAPAWAIAQLALQSKLRT